jgi:hypothetical protein
VTALTDFVEGGGEVAVVPVGGALDRRRSVHPEPSISIIIYSVDSVYYEYEENGLSDYEGSIVTHEFLRELADHLEVGEQFDIQTAGFTKCRFPVTKRYVVRDGEVLHTDLSSPDPIDE